MKIGRELSKEMLTMYNHEKLFPNMETFYFIELTQDEDVVELYQARKSKENPEDDFVTKIAVFYEPTTAKIVMNQLNNKLKKIVVK